MKALISLRWFFKKRNLSSDGGKSNFKMKQLSFMGLICTAMLFIVYRTTNYQYRQTEMEEKMQPFITEKESLKGSVDLESLPSGIIHSSSDLELKPLWSKSSSRSKSNVYSKKSLLAMAVGIKQKDNVDAMVRKFLPENFTVILFHYDGNVNGWWTLDWSNEAIHIVAQNQTKWWFAKRFLHPDIVSIYDYVFLWDEDLGLENFHAGRYLEIVRSEGLEISQPALDPNSTDIHHKITIRKRTKKLHRRVYELRGNTKCSNASMGPPCTGWVEGMAPVFSRSAWYCVWHLIQSPMQVCKAKYRDLKRRHSNRKIWFEELRKRRVAELKKALEQSEDSIGSLRSRLETLKAAKEDKCGLGYSSSQTESPTPFQRLSNSESSGKESLRDGLSASSFTLDSKSCHTATVSSIEMETKPDVSESPERDKVPEISQREKRIEPSKQADIVLSIEKLPGTIYGGQYQCVRKKRAKRKRKFFNNAGILEESNVLGKVELASKSLGAERSKRKCFQVAKASTASYSEEGSKHKSFKVAKACKGISKQDCLQPTKASTASQNEERSKRNSVEAVKATSAFRSKERSKRGVLQVTKVSTVAQTEDSSKQDPVELAKALTAHYSEESSEEKSFKVAKASTACQSEERPKQKVQVAKTSSAFRSKESSEPDSLRVVKARIASPSEESSKRERIQASRPSRASHSDESSKQDIPPIAKASKASPNVGSSKRDDGQVAKASNAAWTKGSSKENHIQVAKASESEESLKEDYVVTRESSSTEDNNSKGFARLRADDLMGIFDSVMKDERTFIFRRRLDSQKRSRYKRLIRMHMDLDTIRSRICSRSITSRKELFRDLLLLATNAIVFYSKRSREHKTAKLLREIVLKSMQQPYDDSVEKVDTPVTSALPNPPVRPRSARPYNHKRSGNNTRKCVIEPPQVSKPSIVDSSPNVETLQPEKWSSSHGKRKRQSTGLRLEPVGKRRKRGRGR